MKKALITSSCLILCLSVVNVYAQSQTTTTSAPAAAPTPTSTTPSTTDKHQMRHSCMTIASACETAGYRMSKSVAGKNIWKDCVTPILAGQTISGVTANPADIQACNASKTAWKSKHGKHNMLQGAGTAQTQTPSASQ